MPAHTPNVSAVDLIFSAGKGVIADDVNKMFGEASEGRLGKVCAYDPESKVSIDLNHTTHSSIFATD